MSEYQLIRFSNLRRGKPTQADRDRIAAQKAKDDEAIAQRMREDGWSEIHIQHAFNTPRRPCGCVGYYCCQRDAEWPQLPWVRNLICQQRERTTDE